MPNKYEMKVGITTISVM